MNGSFVGWTRAALLSKIGHVTPAVGEETAVRESLFRPTRDRVLLFAWIVALSLIWVQLQAVVLHGGGYDSHTYWMAWRTEQMYDLSPGETGAYLYSPLFAQVVWPLTLLPWAVFAVLWWLLGAAAIWWMVRPVGWVWGVPIAALALEDLRIGNLIWLLALATALGVRHATAWVVPAVTKIGPGAGVLWFAGRGDWRSLGRAAVLGVLLVAASWALGPDLWAQWLSFLRANSSWFAMVRIAAAAIVAVWAGRTARPWLLVITLLLASPVLGVYTMAVLVCLPRLWSGDTVARLRVPFGGFRATVRRALDLA